MLFMNEFDVEEALYRFTRGSTPNLGKGAILLARLVSWTNENSDGWAYWPLPVRAAKRLQELLLAADRYNPQDVPAAEVRKALTPIKSFLTRQGVAHEDVLGKITV